MREYGEKTMEHFQENKKEKSFGKEKMLTAKEKQNALRSLKQECFFEYDIRRDVLWLSRDTEVLGVNGTKISDFKSRMRRIGRICEDDMDTCISYLNGERGEKIEFRYVKKDGTYMWCMAKGSFICDEEGQLSILVGCITDIDYERNMREMLVEQAMLDPLTKLYSRTKAQGLIENFFRKEGSFGKHALMLVNIRDFGRINEAYGNVFGDGVLSNIGERLIRCFRKKDIVCRVGGDDFLVLLKDITGQEALQRKIAQVRKSLGEAFAGEDLKIFCDIGMVCFPKDGTDFETLFRNADVAMFVSSKNSEIGSEIFDASCKLDGYEKKGEYFHDYTILETVKEPENKFGREITDFAVDIMLDSKDVTSAIKVLLEKIGKYYCCDDVLIIEKDEDQVLHTTYSWNKNEGINHFNAMRFVDLKDYSSLDNYFDENGLRVFQNTNMPRKHSLHNVFVKMIDAKALLQCAFFENKELKGCICIGHRKKVHEWSLEEKDTLLTITKLLSVYLLKLRASEKIQNRIAHLKNYDTLTKLPTMYKFQNDVMEILENNKENEYVIVYMDINKFKYINDTLGYEAGDELLREISHTLSAEELDILLMARVSSDNFLLLMNYENQQQVKKNLKELNNKFLEKIDFCSVGKSTYLVCGVAKLNYGKNVKAVIDNANLARKHIKKNAENKCCFYDDELEKRVKMELDICNSMQQALDEEEFIMYLQPKVDLETNQIAGAEALTRWKRKDDTFMFPDQFIPLFERNGFIIQLDFYIYECACKTIQKWKANNIKPVTISVNVSRVHLNTDDFVEKVLELVDRYEIEHQYLEFELTESIFLDNTKSAILTMHQLKDKGFLVSIDDFGAGYSSLNLLKDMTSDVLKLDKEFFSGGDMKQEEKIIVSSITNMAKQLKMKVLSEGVETKSQSEFLKEIECDLAQGYLYAKPMPEEEFTELLRKGWNFTK